jgi:hypothetical protein
MRVGGAERRGVDATPAERGAEHDPLEVRNRFERQASEIRLAFEPVRRRVEVRAGVRDHLDPADVELGPRRVGSPRVRARQVIADDGRREAGVGDETVVDGVREVDEGHGCVPLRRQDLRVRITRSNGLLVVAELKSVCAVSAARDRAAADKLAGGRPERAE